MGNGEWGMENGEWRIGNYRLPITQRESQVLQVGRPDGRCYKLLHPRNALPPQRTGEPITNYLFPNSQLPIPNYQFYD
ncbi:hypothetical protein PI95_014835 [Hassallia byssoidea VB512170]|uniref:Uncharacterized protein n=1 Tax=Hassallia byssoidea VB512170 TaxID=1304833 RepID=A0A846H8Y0_9CYAN|nr:hypothetical protein [Hassalia byssoidea]NEU73802.1 hypothetical protein [Hassalia byssoidea VB512170]